jgi:tRNA(fMet)-specific endonuclease VapC
MQKYLIDTCVIIEFLSGNPKWLQRIKQLGIDNCYVSEFTLCELYYGAYHVEGTKYFAHEIIKINSVLDKFKILQGTTFSENFGKIKAYLIKHGQKVDDMDILIGSLAVANGMTVVTDNEKHFSRMPDIKCENWLER